MKYYFRYEGTSAKVYKKSEVLIASFKYGIDAKEYVEFKNETM